MITIVNSSPLLVLQTNEPCQSKSAYLEFDSGAEELLLRVVHSPTTVCRIAVDAKDNRILRFRIGFQLTPETLNSLARSEQVEGFLHSVQRGYTKKLSDDWQDSYTQEAKDAIEGVGLICQWLYEGTDADNALELAYQAIEEAEYSSALELESHYTKRLQNE
jgi:hypothetical protein